MTAVTRPSPTLFVRILDAWTDLRLIGLMRAGFGVIVILHFRRDLIADRLPVERFNEPWWSWLPEPDATAYRVLLWIAVVAALAMIVGVASRFATWIAFGVVLYLLVLDLASFGHNRAFLTWMLFGLAVLPTDRAWSMTAWWAQRRGRPLDSFGYSWPVLMLRIVVSGVYLASAGTKLLDSAWRSGLVLWDRTLRFEHTIPGAFDGWIHELLVSRWFHRLLAPGAILTELAIAVGLWIPRTRRWALGLAVIFHLSIEITAKVQTFSYSAIAALLIWLVPLGLDRSGGESDSLRPPTPEPNR